MIQEKKEKNVMVMDNDKKYKDALERAKKVVLDCTSEGQKVVEYIFPELKESEDEKIRKALIKHFKVGTDYIKFSGFSRKQVLAYLEKRVEKDKEILVLKDQIESLHAAIKALKEAHKIEIEKQREKNSIDDLTQQEAMDIAVAKCFEQGKQKSADKVEPKFHEGDCLVNIEYGDVVRVLEVLEDNYRLDFGGDTIGTLCTELIDNDYRLWDITKDAKDGDLIYVSTEEKGIQAIFHEYKNRTIFFHCYLCCDFVQGSYMPMGSVELVYPLKKVHYKRFFEKMKEAGYTFDFEKKELKKIEQPKLTEFEDAIKDMMDAYRDAIDKNDATVEEVKKHAAYLLSLIPQNKIK